MNNVKSIAEHVLALPEVSAWPEIARVFERAASKPRPDWDWPLIWGSF